MEDFDNWKFVNEILNFSNFFKKIKVAKWIGA